MKILMVSIVSPHFFNWTEQLRDSGHEIYWFDVFDSQTRVKRLDFVHQIQGWRYRFNFPGRYAIKKFPILSKCINWLNERKFQDVFEQKLKEIKPDVVHSFVMYLGAGPILEVMKRNQGIKWIYSSWGSDLYYYRGIKEKCEELRSTLPYIDFLFTDCARDLKIARENGFKGVFLGVFPGGGGYDLLQLKSVVEDINERNLILIKGYEGLHGRCITVLRALLEIKSQLLNFEIKIFGSEPEVVKFAEMNGLTKWENFELLPRIDHSSLMEQMGRSVIYIGNSLSDGIPNTLLEAIVMDAFPIQSNPGGATEELITDRKNGYLISDPNDPVEIRNHILRAIGDDSNLQIGVFYNRKNIRPFLDRDVIKEEVLEKYKQVEDFKL